MTFLYEAVVFLGAAVLAVPLFRKLGLGAVLGYLAAGVVIGPWSLRLVSDPSAILHFGEIGVVFLLFLIGLEIQPARLRVLRRSVFGLGTAQVVLTGIALSAIGWYLTGSYRIALISGFGLALSSTALVLQLLAEKKQLNSPFGRAGFGVLLFQDLAVIPMIAALPLLGARGQPLFEKALLYETSEVFAILLAFVVVGRYLLRPVLRIVANTGTHELFTAAALLIVIGAALAMDSVGISMGLGAFAAGVLVADSEYRTQLEADLQPFKGLLLGLFFMAVGMSANVGLLVEETVLILALTLLLILVKVIIVFPLGRLYGLNSANAVNLSLHLAQGGEFAFILFTSAGQLDLLSPENSQLLTVVVTLSMMLTPAFLWLAQRLLPGKPGASRPYDDVEDEAQVIIAGFGRVGQITGRLLTSLQISFTALDPDPEQVELVRRFGNQAFYGDPGRLDVLRAAHADKARLFVIAVDDPPGAVRIAESVKHHFPNLKILARARNRQHALDLRHAGCDFVMRETFLSSLELAHQTLCGLGFSEEDASRTVAMFREHDERTLEKQYALREDMGALIQSAREARQELERLLETDRQKRR